MEGLADRLRRLAQQDTGANVAHLRDPEGAAREIEALESASDLECASGVEGLVACVAGGRDGEHADADAVHQLGADERPEGAHLSRAAIRADTRDADDVTRPSEGGELLNRDHHVIADSNGLHDG